MRFFPRTGWGVVLCLYYLKDVTPMLCPYIVIDKNYRSVIYKGYFYRIHIQSTLLYISTSTVPLLGLNLRPRLRNFFVCNNVPVFAPAAL